MNNCIIDEDCCWPYIYVILRAQSPDIQKQLWKEICRTYIQLRTRRTGCIMVTPNTKITNPSLTEPKEPDSWVERNITNRNWKRNPKYVTWRGFTFRHRKLSWIEKLFEPSVYINVADQRIEE